MKRNYLLVPLSLIIFIAAFTSCKKKYDVGIIPDCRISSVKDSSSPKFFFLSYNSSGKLESVYDTNNGGYKYLYFNSHVDVLDTIKNGASTPNFRFILGTNGYASMKYVTITDSIDTVFYHYNGEGYLDTIERHLYNNNIPVYDHWYKTVNNIANGNITSFVQFKFDNFGSLVKYHELQIEYYDGSVNRQNSNILNFNTYSAPTKILDKVTSRLDFSSYAGLLGKPNKNLIKKINLDGQQYFEYSYSSDIYDYAVTLRQIDKPNSIFPTQPNVYSITYINCKEQ